MMNQALTPSPEFTSFSVTRGMKTGDQRVVKTTAAFIELYRLHRQHVSRMHKQYRHKRKGGW